MFSSLSPAFTLIPFANVLSFLSLFVYPAYRTLLLCNIHNPSNITSSVRAQEGSSPTSEVDFKPVYVHWLCYWVLYAVYHLLEDTVIRYAVPFFPLYFEIKALGFYWLWSEEFQGAGWLWYRLLDCRYGKIDKVLVDMYNKHCPASVKMWLQEKGQGSAAAGAGGSTGGEKKGAGGFDSTRDVVKTMDVSSLGGRKS
eukprot:GHVQ01020614.1.p1 GENE.GHVQ01020614.1~~GHVQ01020614.1.p1  ORF type:complete len:197 (+),score=32.18 GHVQ01020614.1:300-890(+)